jgi:hypothetical protein
MGKFLLVRTKDGRTYATGKEEFTKAMLSRLPFFVKTKKGTTAAKIDFASVADWIDIGAADDFVIEHVGEVFDIVKQKTKKE